MASSLKVQQKPKIFVESGSPFDATNFETIKTRPGGHDCIPTKNVDISAFSYSKRTDKPSPKNFVKSHTGFGGTISVIIIIIFIHLFL